MRKALEGYRLVPPHVEYREKMTLRVGERSFELMYLKGVHSEADTAVWLPAERVLFSASGIVVDQFNILRPFVTIPDILAASKMMKALKPEFVVPGHAPARHNENLRRHGKVLRLAGGAGRQDGEGR